MHPKYINTNTPILVDDIVLYKPKNAIMSVTSVGLTQIGCVVSMFSKHTHESYTTDDWSEIALATPEQKTWYDTETAPALVQALKILDDKNEHIVRIIKPHKRNEWLHPHNPSDDVYIIAHMSEQDLNNTALWHIANASPVQATFGTNAAYLTREDITIITPKSNVTPNIYPLLDKIINDEPYDTLTFVPSSDFDVIMEELDNLANDYDIELSDELDFARKLIDSYRNNMPRQHVDAALDFWCYKYQSYILDSQIPKLYSAITSTEAISKDLKKEPDYD